MRRLALLAALVVGAMTALPSAAFAETVMITGANSGIGLEFTKQYIAKGWTIIVTHRRAETPKSLADLAAKYDKLRIEKLDVTSEDQVHALAFERFDLLQELGLDAGEREQRRIVAGGEHLMFFLQHRVQSMRGDRDLADAGDERLR